MSGSVLGELVLRSAIPVAIATSPSSIALTGSTYLRVFALVFSHRYVFLLTFEPFASPALFCTLVSYHAILLELLLYPSFA